MADTKRYMVSGGMTAEGDVLPVFVVAVEGEELEVPLREEAQRRYKDGADPDEVAAFMGGTVVDE